VVKEKRKKKAETVVTLKVKEDSNLKSGTNEQRRRANGRRSFDCAIHQQLASQKNWPDRTDRAQGQEENLKRPSLLNGIP